MRAELEQHVKDISDDISNLDDDDGLPDLAREDRMTGTWQKVKALYPHIKNKKDFGKYTIDELMQHSNVKDVLGKTVLFSEPSLKKFATRIRPYIVSRSPKEDVTSGDVFEQWPLVQLVNLEVKSRVLKDGVCLVDLPGSHDSNAARCAIAQDRQKNLAVSCIVAKTVRAADEKPVSTSLIPLQSLY